VLADVGPGVVEVVADRHVGPDEAHERIQDAGGAGKSPQRVSRDGIGGQSAQSVEDLAQLFVDLGLLAHHRDAGLKGVGDAGQRARERRRRLLQRRRHVAQVAQERALLAEARDPRAHRRGGALERALQARLVARPRLEGVRARGEPVRVAVAHRRDDPRRIAQLLEEAPELRVALGERLRDRRQVPEEPRRLLDRPVDRRPAAAELIAGSEKGPVPGASRNRSKMEKF